MISAGGPDPLEFCRDTLQQQRFSMVSAISLRGKGFKAWFEDHF